MKTYDFAFSLGWACGCSQALRAAGLQFASYPFDWLGAYDILCGARVIANGFDRFLEAEDLRLIEVSHGAGFCTRMYLNERTGFGFSHEFSDFEPFAQSFPNVQKVYHRRSVRFLEELQASRRILAVYVEQPERGRINDADVAESLRLLRASCPQATVEILCFYEDPQVKRPQVVSEADGITVVAADYQVMDGEIVTQFMNLSGLTAFLREQISVVDRRTPEEKAKFAADQKRMHSGRWGYDKSAFRRWLNQRAYKAYRSLEKILRKRGLIHRERKVVFWDEQWIREHGRVS